MYYIIYLVEFTPVFTINLKTQTRNQNYWLYSYLITYVPNLNYDSLFQTQLEKSGPQLRVFKLT